VGNLYLLFILWTKVVEAWHTDPAFKNGSISFTTGSSNRNGYLTSTTVRSTTGGSAIRIFGTFSTF
jgi:hypothetical protein